jgi:hypothetical protein
MASEFSADEVGKLTYASGKFMRLIGVALTAAATALAANASSASASPTASTPGWRITQVFSGDSYPLSLTAMSADNAKDAWAVEWNNPTALTLEHWNGGKWQPVAAPAAFGGADNDSVIDASSASDVWTFPTVSGATSVTQYGLRWNGHSWTTFNFKNEQIWEAAAFGVDNAWVFGEQPGKATPAGYGPGYVAHYNGSGWKQFSFPGAVVGTAKLAGNDIWAVSALPKTGSYDALHWNGTKWGTLAIPVLPAVNKDPWVVNAFAATGRTDIWVKESLAVNRGTGEGPAGMTLLHWNGSKWSVADKVTHWYLEGLTPDGHGGFWMVGHRPTSVGYPAFDTYIAHYSGGKWTFQAAPPKSGYTDAVGYITAIPGTSSFWALGQLSPTGNNSGLTSATILKYGL